eukprot:gene14620-14744_t
MDRIDHKILDILQRDASLPIAEIADRVGLSQTPCWKRIQKLEALGIIEKRVAIVSPEKIGLGLTAFVAIESLDHSTEGLRTFATIVSAMPEVVQFHRLAGDIDYLLQVAVQDVTAYDKFYQRLIAVSAVKNVTSRFVVERIKATTAYQIPA